jgi:hypothetical protein
MEFSNNKKKKVPFIDEIHEISEVALRLGLNKAPKHD